MYIKNLFNELKTWYIVKKVLKENIVSINELGFNIDWVGRLYTVMPISEEIKIMPISNAKDRQLKDEAVQLHVKSNLVKICNLMYELKIIDLIMYPDYVELIQDTDMLLVVLKPSREYFTLKKVLLLLLSAGVIITSIVFLIKFIITNII